MISYAKETYLRNLNTTGKSIWMPKIAKQKLKEIQAAGNLIAIGHDWFSSGSYAIGFFCFHENKLIELQKHPECQIANDGDFIFECGTLDHKGLIAIEVPKSMSFCHIEAGRDGNGDWIEKICFSNTVSKDFKKEILKKYADSDDDFSVKLDVGFLFTVEEYHYILQNYNYTLI